MQEFDDRRKREYSREDDMNTLGYQVQAARTLINGPDFKLSDQEFMILWCAIGLTGETGEVLNLIKKGLLHQHGLDREKLKEEIGDCLWYLTSLCTVNDFDLSQIMQDNIKKLEKRYPNGFSSEDSQKRVDIC